MSAAVQKVQSQLNSMGWRLKVDGDLGPATRAAVADFQRGWYLGDPLLIDGKPGARTRSALDKSVAEGGRVSPNFLYKEFACKCGGRYAGCARVRTHRSLVAGLESYRAALGHQPVSLVSAYRCAQHNARVGGATASQHVYGAAVDLEYALTTTQVLRLRRFSGIGQKGGRVRHVDVRHASGNNPTGGTPDRPTIWAY